MPTMNKSIPIATLVAHLEKMAAGYLAAIGERVNVVSNADVSLSRREDHATWAVSHIHKVALCRRIIADITTGQIAVASPKKPKRKARR